MRLAALLAAAELTPRQVLGDAEAADVSSLTLDSRAVASGALYCCVPGEHFDGHDFAPQAVDRGATALLCQHRLELPVPQVVVGEVRPAVGPLAAALYDHPSRAMTVVGVTGTNGKTTTTALLESVFTAAGLPAATIGTLSGARTTPEAPELQATLASFRAEGRAAVAMEVSSHALVQHRVDAVWFAAAIFTNLSQDHLDYHATMDDYFEAKARLFEPGRVAAAVVNADDPWGQRLLTRLRRQGDLGTESQPIPFSLLDLEGLAVSPDGSRFRWRGIDVRLRLGGRFNVRNALAAATAAEALGLDRHAIVAGMEQVEAVRGRFEPVRGGQPFTVLVDYAHTPDGLQQALLAARELADGGAGHSASGRGRVIVVFGAGGDRDQAKRPLMGAVATELADLAVLTSDNPRSEDPLAIISQVANGAQNTNGKAQLEIEVDRQTAIGIALEAAEGNDVVVIAGKGHEIVQEVAGRVIAFDDADVARRALARIGHDRGAW
ncbi:MAG: UDP-N-acetylmuramoyl-L-alanyl-D-glutamate--2,6-diaminopimelate ligase [Acidimicrobiaceae bacterium]|nr:UDP-N-acetylmuramoyl-L-alanyl-D-glutamate--2,6-diaminopimelate ligase [Acidimicrobiaceae bacterium]